MVYLLKAVVVVAVNAQHLLLVAAVVVAARHQLLQLGWLFDLHTKSCLPFILRTARVTNLLLSIDSDAAAAAANVLLLRCSRREFSWDFIVVASRCS